MPSKFDSLRREPPIAEAFFVALGITAWSASRWVGLLDVPARVERRIASAGGAVSAETAEWLRTLDLAAMLGWCGTALFFGGILFHLTRPAWRRLIAAQSQATADESAHTARRWPIVLVAVAAVFLRNHDTLSSGYFRYDDFELLSVARELRLWEAWWRPHGDHFLPLTRLLAFLGWHVAGVTAWPYNLFVLLALSSVVAIGCLLLAELRVSLFAQLGFVTLVVFWSPWAELAAGYYVLSTYLLITASGLAAAWMYLRWRRRRSWPPFVAALSAVGAAPLVDVSGWYVPPAVAVFLLGDFFLSRSQSRGATWFAEHRRFIPGLALVSGVVLAATFYCYGVLYRGTFLSMAASTPRSLARSLVDFAYLIDAGLLLSLSMPFVYARLSRPLFFAASAVMLMLAASFLSASFRAASRDQRRTLATCSIVLLGICLMVALGRPSGPEVFVRWAAKHIGAAYVWLCLLLAAAWDVGWRRAALPRRMVVTELTVVALLLFCGIQTAFGTLGLAVTFPPFGYPAEIRDARRRSAAVSELKLLVIDTLVPRDSTFGEATIPTLDGAFIEARYPSLFSYNLSHYAPFFQLKADRVQLVRNEAMQTWHSRSVTTVPVLRDAVSPVFWSKLKASSALRALYFGEVELRSEQSRGEAGTSRIVDSDGTAEILIRDAGWDPEMAPRLRVALERVGAESDTDIPVTVAFRGDNLDEQHRAKLRLRGRADVVHVADLRQLCAFALNRNVRELRVILTQPGRYIVRTAEIGP